MIIQPYLDLACEAARKASEAILQIYKTDFVVEKKADMSPITLADREANRIISTHLKASNFPILSEEGENIPYEVRKDWEYFWLVDPLDGTKEFAKKSDNFAINIALLYQNKPILGVVLVPVFGKLYFAHQGAGAFLIDKRGVTKPIETARKYAPNASGLRIATSCHHHNEATRAFVAQYPNAEVIEIGSSSKLLLIAEGKVNMCPRFAPTMEWDTAAAQVILEEAGGQIFIMDSKNPLIYNKPDLQNPYFLATDNCNW